MEIKAFVRKNPVLIAILVLATVLRLYHLNFQSLWLDELHTMKDANPAYSMSEVYSSIMAADPHPPLYFYLIQILFKIFGYTPIAARIFSAVLGIYAIYAIYKLGTEMANKEVGLIAALFLCINSYHIYYSQDARPYTMLCLFTILSFLFLIRFIKIPNRRNALLYALMTTLMLYGHFFSLFVLVGQMVSLLFFWILSKQPQKKEFLINSVLAGLVVLVLFVPASLKIFFVAQEIKNFWIPMPTPDIYTLMVKEFFGNAEIVLYILGLMTLLYLVKIAKTKSSSWDYDRIVENKPLFGFIVFVLWIVPVIFIPLVRSYTTIPMIITRYFINILPAILIIAAIGAYQLKNQIIRWSLIGIFLLFSATDLLVVKKFYWTVNKTQFREVTQFIIDNNQKKDLIVTNVPWHISYFLDNGPNQNKLIDSNLDKYVAKLSQNPQKIHSFWYVDGHVSPYKVTPETQQFLDSNFVVDKNIDLFDCYTKHYIPLSQMPKTIEISKYGTLKQSNGDPFQYSIENFESKGGIFKISGWAYLPEQESKSSVITVALLKDGVAHRVETLHSIRPDVTQYFKSKFNLDNSGFAVDKNITSLESGTYQVLLYIQNSETKKEGLVLTDKTVQK